MIDSAKYEIKIFWMKRVVFLCEDDSYQDCNQPVRWLVSVLISSADVSLLREKNTVS